ncbi:Tim23 [Blastocystis hominis]|uniref:Tim23 n=1 Tax=Blastocystis hominis TaxID=12968 RepID=D8M3I5_BLAHO|nr:Tim23 [Blastocystis hominis]CBK22458.2 Tim23 [Blastocystis hominis]|eukprot:XP_012896506.1 Tim23 [Blastocystis hominis]
MLGLVDNEQPDYVDQGVNNKASTANSHNVAMVYISGLLVGSLYGSVKGLKLSPSPVFKIRLNSMLNNGAKYGTTLGNYLGVCMWMYGLANTALPYLRLDTYTTRHDYLGPIICGFTTGFVFKSTAGIRGACVAGIIGAGVITAIRFTQNTILPKLGVSNRRAHMLIL